MVRKCPDLVQIVFLVACLITIFFTLQVTAEKEPHEEIKENDSGKVTSSKETEATGATANDPGFTNGFVASLSVIIVSELGDKTFFIAAIMAMRHSRVVVFSGAILALVVMTIISALFGWVTYVIPRVYTYYISTALFAIFGLKMLKEGYQMSPNEGKEELEEVQSDLKKRDDEMEMKEVGSGTVVKDEETGNVIPNETKLTLHQKLLKLVPKIFLQALTMTFLAEWGDRSQLATILLAAREDVFGVTLGAVIGHALCTGLAVIGGRMIAQKISVKTVTLIGGVVFLIFAVSALFFDPEA